MEVFPTSSSPPPPSNPSNPLGFHLLLGPILNAFPDQRLPPLVLQFPLGTTLDETTNCQIEAVCTNLHNFSLNDDGEGNQRVRLVSSIHSAPQSSGTMETGAGAGAGVGGRVAGTGVGTVGRAVIRTLGSTGSIGSTGAGSIGSNGVAGSNGIAVDVGSMRSAIRAASGGDSGENGGSAVGTAGGGSDTGLNSPSKKYAVLQGLRFPAVGDWLVRLSVWRQGVRVAEVEAGLVTVLEREVWETLPERVRTLSKFRILHVGDDIL